jgi:hypothetical protein
MIYMTLDSVCIEAISDMEECVGYSVLPPNGISIQLVLYDAVNRNKVSIH